MLRRRNTDWTPTFGIAITALTAFSVYLSLKVDRLVQAASETQGAQRKADEEAAKDREDLRARSDRRTRRIGWALTVMGLVIAALGVKITT
jgi:hypothetical protein